ncbi:MULTISPECIES: hypothetical protein [Candidatus Ichthyocystis]|uniref:Uncharacterized protein n=1 Tax=Candidatus Ichthyocystis hellenicum TaxID=1561003 RepID=A0A0S4M306_9BURK|nr:MULTISPECIES: hypothetical protein [Ichthyocystis]CUT18153.1 hypothetical protein Ark11_1349 [Candidatus Ichthyocystis hellenicum]
MACVNSSGPCSLQALSFGHIFGITRRVSEGVLSHLRPADIIYGALLIKHRRSCFSIYELIDEPILVDDVVDSSSLRNSLPAFLQRNVSLSRNPGELRAQLDFLCKVEEIFCYSSHFLKDIPRIYGNVSGNRSSPEPLNLMLIACRSLIDSLINSRVNMGGALRCLSMVLLMQFEYLVSGALSMVGSLPSYWGRASDLYSRLVPFVESSGFYVARKYLEDLRRDIDIIVRRILPIMDVFNLVSLEDMMKIFESKGYDSCKSEVSVVSSLLRAKYHVLIERKKLMVAHYIEVIKLIKEGTSSESSGTLLPLGSYSNLLKRLNCEIAEMEKFLVEFPEK